MSGSYKGLMSSCKELFIKWQDFDCPFYKIITFLQYLWHHNILSGESCTCVWKYTVQCTLYCVHCQLYIAFCVVLSMLWVQHKDSTPWNAPKWGEYSHLLSSFLTLESQPFISWKWKVAVMGQDIRFLCNVMFFIIGLNIETETDI